MICWAGEPQGAANAQAEARGELYHSRCVRASSPCDSVQAAVQLLATSCIVMHQQGVRAGFAKPVSSSKVRGSWGLC